MMPLPEAWSAILGAIVDGALAWSTIEDILGAITCEYESIGEVLYELELNGLVEHFESASGTAYTLSLLASDCLKVHIIECGLSERPRWQHNSVAGRRCGRYHRRTSGQTEEVDLAGLIDPRPGPAEVAEANDEPERWRPRGPLKVGHLPRPTVLLTGADPHWSESRRNCTACHGLPLKTTTYCLRCDRWGFDGVVARDRRAKITARDAG